ncbi:hypothetical protein LX64_00706 [Chitinophaga skermanii]|uniref:Uncharacterized protein n=1 Tax=Chitinophaga skermanii TaxID=331697 RepID=A0A327R4U5_9BACT|nr:hypothetical protein [Chitinophaga skermanii]RAJ11098.1 hypothetical protein LX64_00706 [Chitinophaga skermanii]
MFFKKEATYKQTGIYQRLYEFEMYYLREKYNPKLDIIHISEVEINHKTTFPLSQVELRPSFFQQYLMPVGLAILGIVGGVVALLYGDGKVSSYIFVVCAFIWAGVFLYNASKPIDPLVIGKHGITFDDSTFLWPEVDEVFYLTRKWGYGKRRQVEVFLVIQLNDRLVYYETSIAAKRMFTAIAYYRP